MKNSNKIKKGYTLVEISKSECKRRGLIVYMLSNQNYLIALNWEHKEFKRSDNSSWGHIYKGSHNFGVVVKKYKVIPNNESIYLICEKPIEKIIKVERMKDMYGGFQNLWTYKCNGYTTFKGYKTAHRVAQGNKASFGVRIGHVIN